MNLSTEQKAALRSIWCGADIFDRKLAGVLRAIEREHPALLTITKPMGSYRGRDVIPYFGAILTASGENAIGRSASVEELEFTANRHRDAAILAREFNRPALARGHMRLRRRCLSRMRQKARSS